MARKAIEIQLMDDERKALKDIVKKSTSEQRMVLRAQIILLAAEGHRNKEIMEILDVSKPVVVKWRKRFAKSKLEGLNDAPRPGKPRVYDAKTRIKIAAKACSPPEGQTHWSMRDLAKQFGKVSHMTVHRILKVEKISHEYIRHGTQSLIAALAVHEGTITGQCFDRHRHEEFLIFLKSLARCYPQRELHLIMDNLSMHKHKEIQKWLKCNKRVQVHFTPTYASWLNQIELWFSILARKIVRRGVFSSQGELVSKIMEFIQRYNKEAKPFRWTYTGDPLTV